MAPITSSPDGGRSRPTRRRFVVGAGALVGTAVTGARATPSSDREPDGGSKERRGSASTDADGLEAFVDDLMATRIGDETPGAVVAVVDGDDLELAKGYGVADVETERPVRADETTFRIGSVGKLVTWTAVMQGVADGTLSLDADVTGYLADSRVDVPERDGDPITLRHLGTHTAGFASAIDPGIVTDPAALTSLETALVEDRPDRVRPPGDAVGYSNYGAMLAGHVVAETRDTSFEEHVRTEIFEPLGMTHSTFAQPVPVSHPGEPAAPHARDGDEFVVPDPVYVNWRPAGSTTATATDVAAFMRAHLNDGAVGGARVLSPDARREMHRLQYERHSAVNGWRYGFYEYGPPDSGLIGHSGGTLYFRSLLVLAPERNVGVFVNYNANGDAADPSSVVDAILDERGLLGGGGAKPQSTTGPASRERAERVAGEYASTMLPRGGPTHLASLAARLSVGTTDDDHLVTESGGDRRTWVETSPYVYHSVEGDDVLAVDVSDGTVTGLHLNSEPQGTYEPVPAHERRLVTGGVVGGSLLGFSASLLGRSARSLYRRLDRGRDRVPSDSAAQPNSAGHADDRRVDGVADE